MNNNYPTSTKEKRQHKWLASDQALTLDGVDAIICTFLCNSNKANP